MEGPPQQEASPRTAPVASGRPVPHPVAVRDDPEARRVEQLVTRLLEGRITDAEWEELELHGRARPDLRPLIRRGCKDAGVGAGWLARVSADEAARSLERTLRTRVERAVGLALLLGGMVLSWIQPAVGGGMIAAGMVTLTVSFLRLALRQGRRDPYRDVDR